MAKKAKLDILEVNIDLKTEEFPPPEIDVDKAEAFVSVDDLPKESLITKVKGWLRVKLLWLILIPATLIFFIAGAFIWHDWGNKSRTTSVDFKKSALPEIESRMVEKFIYYDGFVVDQKNDKNQIQIAFCDVAIELDQAGPAKKIGERFDVRNIIYAVLKRKRAEDGLSPEKRNMIKMEIKSDLNKLLGENTVSHVYFTNYELN